MKVQFFTEADWLDACIARYKERGGLDEQDALDFSETCAEYQRQTNGYDVAHWDSPVDCADADMEEWTE